MIKYFSIFASIIAFICWILTYSLLKEQFDYVKSKEIDVKKYEELEKELKARIDSTNAVLKNVNANLYSIQRNTKWMSK